MNPERMLTPAEVVKLLGVTTQTLRRWSNAGILEPVVTPGGHRRFRAGDIVRLSIAADDVAEK